MKRTPLRRKKRLSPKRKMPRRETRVRDPLYLERVAELACCVAAWESRLGPELSIFPGFEKPIAGRQISRCYGRVEAHHAATWKRGLGQKCDDTDAIALCMGHHSALHRGSGPFKGMDKWQRRAWAEERIAETQARLLSHGSRRSA